MVSGKAYGAQIQQNDCLEKGHPRKACYQIARMAALPDVNLSNIANYNTNSILERQILLNKIEQNLNKSTPAAQIFFQKHP
jgi:hypothetical protein